MKIYHHQNEDTNTILNNNNNNISKLELIRKLVDSKIRVS